jgi:cholesterol transport system auxiliary component
MRLASIDTTLMLLALAGGCALTSKSEPLAPRYFDPDLSSLPVAAADTENANANEPALRLGRVIAAEHLRERIVFREANRELGFYEDRRWTETPDFYLRRALADVLFERKGIRRVVGGAGLTLDVELLDFEEVKKSPPVAHVRATFVLHDGRSVVRERTIDVDRPIATEGKPDANTTDAAVHAMSLALSDLVSRVANAVAAEMAKQPAPPPVPPQ